MLISQIIIGERVRKDMGDLQEMAESIKRNGLILPVAVRRDRLLIDGERRIRAATLLGWKEIRAVVGNPEDFLSAENDANSMRKDWTPMEKLSMGEQIEEAHRKKIEAQKHVLAVAAGRKSGEKRTGKATARSNEPPVEPAGESGAAAAQGLGMSKTTYYRTKAVAEAAQSNPEKFGDLARRLESGEPVNGLYDEMKSRKDTKAKKPRHAMNRKKRYLNHTDSLQKISWSLAGVSLGLQDIKGESLDPEKARKILEEIHENIRRITNAIRKLSREV